MNIFQFNSSHLLGIVIVIPLLALLIVVVVNFADARRIAKRGPT